MCVCQREGKRERDREGEKGREREIQSENLISQLGRQVASYEAEYDQSSLSALRAECTIVFLRNHFGHKLHGPFQNVLSSLVLSIGQPSHNSPGL